MTPKTKNHLLKSTGWGIIAGMAATLFFLYGLDTWLAATGGLADAVAFGIGCYYFTDKVPVRAKGYGDEERS